MEDIFDKEENAKNIYVIKHKLAMHKKLSGDGWWDIQVGDFFLKIAVSGEDYWTAKGNMDDVITNHKELAVDLYEDYSKSNRSLRRYVDLKQDPRFKNYLPIQYDVIETPTGGRINMSDGKKMPLLHLCELIHLLHRLSNLTAFM